MQFRSNFVQKILAVILNVLCTQRRVIHPAVVILACLFSILSNRALIANDSIQIQNVHVGIDGQFRVGCWAPIEFDIVADKSSETPLTVQIRTADPDGHGVISQIAEMKQQAENHVTGLFRSGRLFAPLTIEVLSNGKLIAEKTIRIDRNSEFRCLKQSAHIWILDGEQPAFSAAAAKIDSIHPGSIHTTSLDSFSSGIKDSRELDSVNLIVLNGNTNPTPETAQALQDWVYRGGRLVICIGPDGDQLKQSSLASWLPKLPTGEIQLRNLGGFNQWVPGSNPMRMLNTVPCAVFSLRDGLVLASDFGNAITLRSACGTGAVTMMGVRLDQRPFDNWSSRDEMAMFLADFEIPWTVNQTNQKTSINAGLSPTGVSDLQTQLIQALDDYEEIERPSYWIVIAWCSILILIIGPLDYFLLHRVLKRPQLTWITLPVWLACLTLWAYTSAASINQAKQTARQIEVLDVDLSTNRIHGRSWMNFYSPETQRYRIQANINSETIPTSKTPPDFLMTSWIERPESSYRGMYRTGGLESQKPTYHLSSDNQVIEDLPVRIWSTGSTATEWEQEITSNPIVSHSLLDRGNGRLTGSFKYEGKEELSDWFVAYGNFAYFPRAESDNSSKTLKPGEVFNFKEARSNMLRGLLTGLTHASIFHDDDKKRQTSLVNRQEYDSLSRNPFTILRTLSFHKSAGGSSYTELSNDSLESADLSSSLLLHRAVLFGKLKQPVTEFTINDEPVSFAQRDSVIRILMPVEFELDDLNAPPDPTLLKIK